LGWVEAEFGIYREKSTNCLLGSATRSIALSKCGTEPVALVHH
jgi:hypothetical protein